MSILHFEWAKTLRKEGKRLGREGMSQRVIELVNEFNINPTYKGAMHLAGQLKAITQAAKCDDYWDEKVNHGFHKELYDITKFKPTPTDQ